MEAVRDTAGKTKQNERQLFKEWSSGEGGRSAAATPFKTRTHHSRSGRAQEPEADPKTPVKVRSLDFRGGQRVGEGTALATTVKE